MSRKPFVGAHTSLSKYELCPYQFYRAYILRDLPWGEKSPEQQWGIDAHAALEKRVSTRTPLPANMAQFEPMCVPFDELGKTKPIYTEYKIGITPQGKSCGYWAPQVWFRGVVDVAAVVVGEPQAVNVDWKTGKTREDPAELHTHGLLLKCDFPWLERVTGMYAWLKEARIGKPHDCSNFEATWGRISKTMSDIAQSERTNFWPKRQTPLCGWCLCTDCQFNTMKERLAREGK
jgi:hypothetical protein